MACFPSAAARSSSGVSKSLRSEEHTSELQSPCNLVCRLLLEKKKQSLTSRSLTHTSTYLCALSLRLTPCSSAAVWSKYQRTIPCEEPSTATTPRSTTPSRPMH